jgi:plasmid stabilization system protein ParE
MNTLYDQDLYAWAHDNAELLRQGRFAEADIEHIAEEIETMGRSERRALESRLEVLLAHLLKWRHQPVRRGKSWQYTIEEQRRKVLRLLRDNPSLRPKLAEILKDAYLDSILYAARETGLDKDSFPTSCPFSEQQIFSDDYWPD